MDDFYVFVTQKCQQRHYVFIHSHLFIRLSAQMLLPQYLMNGLNKFDKNFVKIAQTAAEI